MVVQVFIPRCIASSTLLKLIAGIGFAIVATAKEVRYEWTLKTVVGDAYSPDCMNTREERRSLFLAEKSFPGPEIVADEGDTIILRITNMNPSAAASIHFHGIHQKGTPYVDGAAYITQCALSPTQSQEYVFDAYPPGTHYWHEHAAYHLADGLSGPIIVRPKDPEPFVYDEERVIFLQDWYIKTGGQQYDGLTSWPFVWVGNPNSLLINGKGIAPECLPDGINFNNSKLCLPSCQNSTLSQLSTVNVTEGKTYRFRIINSAQLVMANFAIAGHNLTIVQIEGTDVEPVTVESIDITPGQRFDVLVTANQTPKSYLIETSVRSRNIVGIYGRAVLHYEGSELELPAFTVPTHPEWNDTEFGVAQDLALKTLNVSKFESASALTVDDTEITRYVIVGTQNQYIVNGTPQLLRWALNNISSIHANEPLIGKAVDTARNLGWPAAIEDTVDMSLDIPYEYDWTQNVSAEGGPGVALGMMQESIMKFTKGQVVELVLQNARSINGAPEFHPWHMHGHSFWIVGQGEGNYDPAVDISTYNLVNPPYRDTVVLQPLSWVALRFVADNPGAWSFHCHILSHSVMGMALTMIIQPDELGEVPPNVRSCTASSLNSTEGDVDGSDNSTDGGSDSGSTQYSLFWNVCTSTVIVSILTVYIF